MKVTKFVHSCLLVETPDRTVLFDPGVMSSEAINIEQISHLDDIFITHIHADRMDIELIAKLVAKFPNVRVTSTAEVVAKLKESNIAASHEAPEGVSFFDSPHESVKPLFPQPPEEFGFHYSNSLSHPGDSHSFKETKDILALPITAPWGSTIKALNIVLDLKPKHVLPIHDWHWREEARNQMYDIFEQILKDQGITFYKLQTGVPVDINI